MVTRSSTVKATTMPSVRGAYSVTYNAAPIASGVASSSAIAEVMIVPKIYVAAPKTSLAAGGPTVAVKRPEPNWLIEGPRSRVNKNANNPGEQIAPV